MKIIHKDNKDINGYFRAVADKEILGTVTYKWIEDGVLEIDHAEVKAENEGEGIGQQLVKSVIDFAKKENIKIKPECPFAKAVIDKMQDIDDVIVS